MSAEFLKVPSLAGAIPGLRQGILYLIAVLWLSFTGCSYTRPGTATATALRSGASSTSGQNLAPVMKQPETYPRSAQAPPEPPRRVSQTKASPATGSKGAEKLVSPNMPASVRASERAVSPAELAVQRAPTANDTNAMAGAGVKELVFKGPPRPARSRRAGARGFVWFGLILCGAMLAGVAWCYYARRHGKSIDAYDASRDEIVTPPELVLREPTDLPREPVMAEKA